MSDSSFLSGRGAIVAGGVIVAVLAVLVFLYEPVTRNYASQDDFCVYCHAEIDYLYSTRLSHTSPHPPEPEEGTEPAYCVDCHLPEGIWNSTYAYTDFISVTDLYGHFRDREGERSGEWIPLSAARAYRVRDRMLEYDSPTCRSCHEISELQLESVRAQRSHDDSIKNKETCIECHMNIVHRVIEPRETGVAADEEEAEPGEFNEFDEFDEFDDSDETGGEMVL